MPALDNNILLLVFLSVIILAAAYTGACFGLIRYWKESVTQAFKELRASLRKYQTQHKQIQLGLQTFSPQDPAPYGDLAAQLEAYQQKIQPVLEDVERRHVALQERARYLERNGSWLHTLTGAPLRWQQLNRETNQLKTTQAQIQTNTQAALEHLKSLEQISLEVARQAQQVWKLGNQTHQWLQRLQQRHLQGDALEKAQELGSSLQQQLKEIPDYFINGSQGEILEKANKESTSQVYALLENLKPRFESLLAQCEAWESQRARTVEIVGGLQHLLQQTLAARQEALPALELGAHDEQIQHIQTVASSLQQTLDRLEIESIPLVAQEASRLSQIVQELHTQFIQAQEQSPQLEGLLNSLAQQLKDLSFLVGSLATKSAYPVQWSQSSASLAALNRQTNALGAANKKRTPEQVALDLEKARQIESALAALTQHCYQADEQYKQIARILESPDFANLPTWLKSAQQIVTQVGEYAAENWPRQDAVASLQANLQQFQANYLRLVPSDRSTPLPENVLSQRLIDLTHLSENYQRLRTRLEREWLKVG